MSQNPLNTYFRKSKFSLTLPSRGRFYGENTDNNFDGTISVRAMGPKDEILFQAPGSNLDGSAIKQIIESCISEIKNAWLIPSVDIDVIIMAIRMASYGNNVSCIGICPECEHKNKSVFDIKIMLDNIKEHTYDVPLITDELKIYLKPMSFKQLNENLSNQTDIEKIVGTLLEASNTDTSVISKLNEAYADLFNLTAKIFAQNIAYIELVNNKVDDTNQIYEWLTNCDGTIFTQIKNAITEKKNINTPADVNVVCENCSNQYVQEFYINATNFFN